MDQIAKDRVILQHLLEAAGCYGVAVNYIIACPNVSILEITRGNFVEEHGDTLEIIGLEVSFVLENVNAHLVNT